VHGFDGCDGAVGQGLVLCGVGDGPGAGVAVGVHPELGVRVDVHVELDALAGCYAVELGFENFGLDAVAGGGAFVVLRAGRCAGAAAEVPLVGPVPVDIAADAAGGWCGLTVLAPHAVGCLSVCEAIWVDNREDVKVVFVLVASNRGIGRGEDLVRSILNDPATKSILSPT